MLGFCCNESGDILISRNIDAFRIGQAASAAYQELPLPWS